MDSPRFFAFPSSRAVADFRISIFPETTGQASLTYLSTLAVLQLDTIMRDAVYVGEKAARCETKNQKQFSRMIQLRHTLPGIGRVRLMVGVKKQDSTKVQYCITSIDAMLEGKSKAASN